MNTDGFRDYIFHADESMVFPYKDEEFIRMWVADMEFATPDVVIDGIRERLDKRIFGYTRVFEKSYFDAFAAWCRRRYGWEFGREELVMSNGVIPALFELVEYICAPDEKVLFLTPSYAYFKYAADHSAREYVCSDLVNTDGYYSIDWDDFERKCADEKTRLFIHCNPHNPSGRVWSPEGARAPRGYTRTARYVGHLGRDTLRSAPPRPRSHASGQSHAGLRETRHLHGPEQDLQHGGAHALKYPHPRRRAAQDLAGAALQLRQPPEHRAARRRPTRRASPGSRSCRPISTPTSPSWASTWPGTCRAAKYRVSEATYLAWVDLGEYFAPDEDLPMFFAYRAGVLLEGGNMFVQNSDCFIRLNLACPRAVLEEGLRRICVAVNTKHTEPYRGEN